MNTLLQQSAPATTYEVYPGSTAESFARDFLGSYPMLLQRFCEKERIEPYMLPTFVEDVLVDWQLSGATHADRQQALYHLINHIRIKARYGQRNNQATTRRSSGTHDVSYERMASIAQAVLRQSSDSDKS